MRRVIFVVLMLALHQGAIAQSHTGAAQFNAIITGAPQSNPITTSAPQSNAIITGAEQPGHYVPLLKGKRVAVFANATSTVGRSHLVDTLLKLGIFIHTIFSPEHGFRGDADAGATVGNQQDPAISIPIVSLYGSKTKPSPADLAAIDVMVYDIQDVGV